MQAFATELAQGGRKLVPVLQPGVKVDPSYETYIDGLAQAAFLRGQDDTPYLGWVSRRRTLTCSRGSPALARHKTVTPTALPHTHQPRVRTRTPLPPPTPLIQAWPGGVHFPDFGWDPAAAEFWRSQLALFASLFDWGGLWVDMQEGGWPCHAARLLPQRAGLPALARRARSDAATRFNCMLPPTPPPPPAVSNFCSGDICTLPTEQALVAQRGLPETVCQALCLSPEAGGLSPANASLVQPPYQIANNLQAEPLNTQVSESWVLWVWVGVGVEGGY